MWFVSCHESNRLLAGQHNSGVDLKTDARADKRSDLNLTDLVLTIDVL